MKKSESVSGFKPNLTFLTEPSDSQRGQDDTEVRKVLNGLLKDLNHSCTKSMNIKEFLNKNMLVF